MLKITKDILEDLEPLREKINGNVEYMILKYDNLNYKDHWSCLCSAMDWIDVTKNNIDSEKINTRDFKLMWKDVYSYLSAIDIIIDAISQIYRVVFETPAKRDIFDDSKEIFNGEYLNMTDYDFFKHIRAIFGSHPVKVSEDSVYKFASWPSSKKMIGGEKDIFAHLYSYDKRDNYKVVGFNFYNTNKLLKKYTGILPEVYTQIKIKKNEFTESNKSKTNSKKGTVLQ